MDSFFRNLIPALSEQGDCAHFCFCSTVPCCKIFVLKKPITQVYQKDSQAHKSIGMCFLNVLRKLPWRSHEADTHAAANPLPFGDVKLKLKSRKLTFLMWRIILKIHAHRSCSRTIQFSNSRDKRLTSWFDLREGSATPPGKLEGIIRRHPSSFRPPSCWCSEKTRLVDSNWCPNQYGDNTLTYIFIAYYCNLKHAHKSHLANFVGGDFLISWGK